MGERDTCPAPFMSVYKSTFIDIVKKGNLDFSPVLEYHLLKSIQTGEISHEPDPHAGRSL